MLALYQNNASFCHIRFNQKFIMVHPEQKHTNIMRVDREVAISSLEIAVSLKQCKIGEKVLTISNRYCNFQP